MLSQCFTLIIFNLILQLCSRNSSDILSKYPCLTCAPCQCPHTSGPWCHRGQSQCTRCHRSTRWRCRRSHCSCSLHSETHRTRNTGSQSEGVDHMLTQEGPGQNKGQYNYSTWSTCTSDSDTFQLPQCPWSTSFIPSMVTRMKGTVSVSARSRQGMWTIWSWAEPLQPWKSWVSLLMFGSLRSTRSGNLCLSAEPSKGKSSRPPKLFLSSTNLQAVLFSSL